MKRLLMIIAFFSMNAVLKKRNEIYQRSKGKKFFKAIIEVNLNIINSILRIFKQRLSLNNYNMWSIK